MIYKPRSREWDIGKDAYGRQSILKHTQTYDGKSVWSIQTMPANQRDDGEKITSLSLENLRTISAIAQDEKP
jgi:hypothetical protein